jgi:hypothetical protein
VAATLLSGQKGIYGTQRTALTGAQPRLP